MNYDGVRLASTRAELGHAGRMRVRCMGMSKGVAMYVASVHACSPSLAANSVMLAAAAGAFAAAAYGRVFATRRVWNVVSSCKCAVTAAEEGLRLVTTLCVIMTAMQAGIAGGM